MSATLPLAPIVEARLVPKSDAPMIDLASIIERVIDKPDLPVDKLQAILDMQRQLLRDRAATEFNRAMAAAQAEMRRVAADAENPQTRSRYASYAALDRALRPIYTKHGFALTFNTADSPLDEHIRVLCDAVHVGGHTKTYTIDMPADGMGAKGGAVMTKTHARGSAASYGMRYLLKLIWNVAVGEDDDDGNAAGGHLAPEGFEDWLDTATAKANEGLAALQAFWQTANRDPELKRYAAYLSQTQPNRWNDLKKQAARVGGSQ
jgi:hypothetical protein